MTDSALFEILLVEDNPADSRLVEEAFAEQPRPLHLSVTPDGVEALAFLRREGRYAIAPHPDLILLDLNLPRKDGREVLAAVKADPALRRIPVLVLTTSDAPADIARAYDLHANCFLTKDPDLDRFFALLHETLHFWLDVARRPAFAGADPRQAPGAAGVDVLVVEDDEGIVQVIEAALGDQGYRVVAAQGEEALRLARELRPVVILCDMSMPEMDGAEVCRRLHADPATAEIPIVIMSAHANLRDAGTLLPVVDRLPKPFDIGQLYRTVERWTPGHAKGPRV